MPKRKVIAHILCYLLTLHLTMSQVVLGDFVIVAVSRVAQSNHSNCACWLRSWWWWAVVWRRKTETLKLNNKVENSTKNHKISLKPDDGIEWCQKGSFRILCTLPELDLMTFFFVFFSSSLSETKNLFKQPKKLEVQVDGRKCLFFPSLPKAFKVLLTCV